MKNKKSGFTLLEILLVVGIIAILAGITIVAINPSKQLAQVRNTQRKSDLKQLNNAITQYYIDNSSYPDTISTTTLTEICNTGSASATTTAINGASCDNLTNLSILVPTYLTAIPADPTGTSSPLSFIPIAYADTAATGTGYKVGISDNKKVLLSAPLAELNVRIVVGDVPTTPESTLGVGLVAHYLMNDNLATTVVLDNTGAHNGTATANTSVMSTAGNILTSFLYNYSNYVNIGNANTFGIYNGLSLSAWIFVTDFNRSIYGTTMIGSDGGTQPISWDAYAGDSQRFFINGGAGGYFVSNTSFNTNTWYHVAVTYDGSGNGVFYRNGLPDGTFSGGSMPSGSANLLIGHRQGSNPIWGKIDDFRIYNRVLNSTEITQLYNSGAGTEEE